ncbi:zinc finger MYM-type protein 1-like [Prorops nasuta]|uniref:zinc finger MYM-type protein 1-like n=1 Tax=Prorops nasuta TaxID=863751 RepID=UPI0034CEBAC4
MDPLDVTAQPVFDNRITKKEMHAYNPYSNALLGNSDEIRIPIQQQDLILLPWESYLYIEGKIIVGTRAPDAATQDVVGLDCNSMAFLFDEIRYELNAMEFKKKLSGSENRKRKAANELEMEKLRGQLNKYFIKTSDDKCDEETMIDNQISDSFPTVNECFSQPSTSKKPLSSDSVTTVHDQPSDPGTWPSIITDKIRKIIVKHGPQQIRYNDYLRDDCNRCFSNIYYSRKATNKEILTRTWLVVELSKLSSDGYLNWQNLSKTLNAHENSKSHLNNYINWINLQKQLKEFTTIDSELEKCFEIEKRHWHAVLQRIVEAIKYLAGQSLALRGSSDVIFRKDNGNFLKLIEIISKFDFTLANHLSRIQNKELQTVHYLGKNIQNEIISLLSKKILQEIVRMVNNSKYYSIILDCTSDVSHIEQMTLIIRFVHRDNRNVTVVEHFLGFVEVSDSIGKGLSQYLLDQLKCLQLDYKNMRGQGYDNGANMRGKKNGVQRHILNVNSRAFFFPCAAHTLNLVICDAANVNISTVNFFNIIQQLYNFFSSSTKRWAILKLHTKLALKNLSTTRWESRIDALRPLRYNIGEIYDTLLEIFENEDNDKNTKLEAKSLAFKIKNYEFLCSVIIWFNIMDRVNVVSKMLQNPNKDIHNSEVSIQNLIDYFKEKRSDVNFNATLESATKLAKELDISNQFNDTTLRRRTKKKLYDYEYTVINSLIERFEVLSKHSEKFKFLYNFENIYDMDEDTLNNHCADLEIFLSDNEEKDINSIELVNEINSFKDWHLEFYSHSQCQLQLARDLSLN